MKLKSIISDEAVNTGRQVTIDFMKAMSIFFMITIHIYEEISVFPDEDPGMFGTIIEFLGGPLAAPIFMIAMGLGIVYSRHRSPKELFNRGIRMFIFAYVLNFLRDGIRMIIYYVSVGSFDMEELIYCLFNIDILHFAGLTFMLTAFLKHNNINLSKTLLISIIMQTIGNVLLRVVSVENTFLQYFLGLFFATCEASCFPLLTWFIYPVIGMNIGRFLKQVEDQEYLHKAIFGACFTIYFALRTYVFYTGMGVEQFFALEDNIYYKQDFLSVLYTFSLFGMVKSITYYLGKTALFKKLEDNCKYIGSNLNEIYINQWLIIGLVGFLPQFEIIDWLGYAYIIPVAIVIYIVSIALAKYTKKFTTKYL